MKSVTLDTNLLLLLVVGSFDRRLIARHKRTSRFSGEDFDLLLSFLERFTRILVTPNVLTETSNLLQQTDTQTSRKLLGALAGWIERFEERFVASQVAIRSEAFFRLGLADAVTLQGNPAESELLTDDLDLYLVAAHSGRTAHNFTHLQAAAWGTR